MAKKKSIAPKTTLIKIAEKVGELAGRTMNEKDHIVAMATNAIDSVKEKIHTITTPSKKNIKKAIKKPAKKVAKKANSVKKNAGKAVKKAAKKATAIKKNVKKATKKSAKRIK